MKLGIDQYRPVLFDHFIISEFFFKRKHDGLSKSFEKAVKRKLDNLDDGVSNALVQPSMPDLLAKKPKKGITQTEFDNAVVMSPTSLEVCCP